MRRCRRSILGCDSSPIFDAQSSNSTAVSRRLLCLQFCGASTRRRFPGYTACSPFDARIPRQTRPDSLQGGVAYQSRASEHEGFWIACSYTADSDQVYICIECVNRSYRSSPIDSAMITRSCTLSTAHVIIWIPISTPLSFHLFCWMPLIGEGYWITCNLFFP